MEKEIKEELLELYVQDLNKHLVELKSHVEYLALAESETSSLEQTIVVLEAFIDRLKNITKISKAKKYVNFDKLYEIYRHKL